jgi:hypothetical protein
MSSWESMTELDAAEVSALDSLATLRTAPDAGAMLEVLIKRNYDDEQESTTTTGEGEIRTVAGFLQWYRKNNLGRHEAGEVDEASESSNEFSLHVETLQGYKLSCRQLMSEVDTALRLLQGMKTESALVASQTKALHSSCDQLVGDQTSLLQRIEKMEAPLKFFNQLQELCPMLGVTLNMEKGGTGSKLTTATTGATISPESAEFTDALERLDESVHFLSANPHVFADSANYLEHMYQLQKRALMLVRHRVVSILETSTQKLLAKQAREKSKAEGGTDAVLYAQFRSVAPRIKQLCDHIQRRCRDKRRRRYAPILQECHQCYSKQRFLVLSSAVQAKLAAYAQASSGDLLELTRKGCAYLIQVCEFEHELFQLFFGGKADDGSAAAAAVAAAVGGTPSSPKAHDEASGGQEAVELGSLVVDLCNLLYKQMRPSLIHQSSMELLCELVHVLQQEVLEEQLVGKAMASTPALRFFEPVIGRMVQDTQERLIFCAQTHIRDEIEGFSPSAADLDYPQKLLDFYAAEAKEQTNATPDAEGADDSANMLTNANIYATWFPALERTLMCLSRIYLNVEMSIFEALAAEAVSMCSMQLHAAAKSVSGKASAVDGGLFLIKSLLTLREQISPFDTDIAVTQQSLDFRASATDALGFLMGGGLGISSLFQLDGNNALLQLLHKGVPSVRTHQIDIKKDLEQQLKLACTAFIDHVTATVVAEVVSFLNKAAAHRQQANSKPLQGEPWAKAPTVKALAAGVKQALEKELPPITSKMALYLANGTTQGILFDPIKRGVDEVLSQLSGIVETDYSSEPDVDEILALIAHDVDTMQSMSCSA